MKRAGTRKDFSVGTRLRLLQWMERFRSARVLVVGDLIVDEYIWGTVDRVSPEAPVPVVKMRSRSLRWGGAANVANNLRTMGARVLVAGVVGKDREGKWLLRDIRRKGISVDGIVELNDRPSTLKTRIIAHNQQVVRIDREVSGSLPKEASDKLLSFLRNKAPEVDAIIVSDYGKGVVDETLMDQVRQCIKMRETIVCVDPKVIPFTLYRGVTAVTPNDREAAKACGVERRDSTVIERVGKELLELLKSKLLLITRGEEGMSLFMDGGACHHIPTSARKVYDVTGAGDTVVSVFTLGLCAGAPPVEAAILANFAAGIAVSEVGTTPVRWKRLARELKKG